MRTYFMTSNFVVAAIMSAIVTLLSVGRLLQSEMPLFTGVVMLFICMTLVCAAVTAWGARAGMAGAWTDGRTLRQGLLAAMTLSLALWPIYLLGLDPRLRAILADAESHEMLRLAFPSTTGTCVALILWATGFQTLFLQAAPMSLAARLTGHRFAALGLCLLFRLYLAHRQVVEAGLADHMTFLMALPAAIGLIGCLLFARFGLLPAMCFVAVLNARLLLPSA